MFAACTILVSQSAAAAAAGAAGGKGRAESILCPFLPERERERDGGGGVAVAQLVSKLALSHPSLLPLTPLYTFALCLQERIDSNPRTAPVSTFIRLHRVHFSSSAAAAAEHETCFVGTVLLLCGPK